MPKLPKDGYYKYRTNPNPETDPWIITGAMKVHRILTKDEVDKLVIAAGREPQKVEPKKTQLPTSNLQPPTSFADFSIGGLHASAHNFRKFSTDYMGTGEGAQAYGWGLYFAENPKTNRSYFHQFNKEHTTLAYQQNGTRIPEADYISILNNIFLKHATPQYPAKTLVSAIRSLMSGKFVKDWNINAEIDFLQQRVDKGQEAYRPLLESLQEIKDKNLTIALIQEYATNYKVELNCSKDDLLSWDEGHVPYTLLKQWKDYCQQHNLGQQKFSFANTPDTKLPKISGQVFYREYLQPTLGSDKAASLWLLDHGYKGIKHVDAASRHPKIKHKTHNFIIFNDADIKITAVNETGRWSLTEGWQSYSDPTADFSVIGPHAKTWDNYIDRAFQGRDDGMLRAEINSSQSHLNWQILQGPSVSAYQKIIEARRTEKLKEKNIKPIIDYAEQRMDLQDKARDLTRDNNPNFIAEEKALREERAQLTEKRKEIRSALADLFESYGDTTNYIQNVSPKTIDELAESIWGAWAETSVIKTLDTDPLNWGMKLKEVLDFPELYAAYPQLADIEVQAVTSDSFDARARYTNGDHAIDINRDLIGDWESLHKILLHEIQHHIQNIEGYAKGSTFEHSRQLINYRAANGDKQAKILKKLKDSQLYARSAGEIEARNVQNRYYFNAETRQKLPFNSTLEFPGEAIVDFSLTAEQNIQNWQLDPTAGLGELGHFGNNITRKLAPVNVTDIDTRLSRLQNFIRRRQKEVQNMHDTNDLDTLIAETQNIVGLVDLLPQGYRFGKEPYIEFLNTYATLIRHADPAKAGQALPMHTWDKKMARSFRKQFNRIMVEEMTETEQGEFADLFSPFLALADINNLRHAIDDAREEAALKFDLQHADQPQTALLVQQRNTAMQEAAQQTLENNKHIADTIYRAIGQMRATRLVDKLLARVYLKIDQYRKDLTLRKIATAIHSITPRKQKNGKPLTGTVTQDTYNNVLTYYRLLRLTKGQKDTLEEANPDLAEAAPEDTIQIPTYDETGAPITLTTTKQEYETYASLDSMTADQAAAAAQAIGTYIAHGKNAWQIIAAEQQQQITDFCAPIYQTYAETYDQLSRRRRAESVSLSGQKGLTHLIRKFLTGTFNDAQLIDTVANHPGLQQFRKIQDAIARAHTYLETAENQNARNALTATLTAIGHTNANIDHLTKQQDKDLARFIDQINQPINLPKDEQITLTPQPPDFKTRTTDTLRQSLLKRLFFVTRKKNYDRNELAAVLQRLRGTMPDTLYNEAWQLYGTHGDPSLFFGDIDKAFEAIFPQKKFSRLTHINQTIKILTAQQLDNWHATADTTPTTITQITPNEAAYRVLLTEQTDLADMLRRQGYTPQIIQQLKTIAGPQMMQLAYTLRDLMNARMQTLKNIYETTYGTPFPAVENYFRAFFDAGTKENNDSQLEGLAFGAGGKNNGSMRLFHTRVKHNKPILPTMSVTHAYQIGMKQQDNIIAYSDPHTYRHIGEFMSKVLANRKGNTRLTTCLDNALGTDIRAAIQEHTQNMFRLYGHADTYASTANRAVRDIGTAATYTLLLARVTSIAKNAVAQFNTLGGSNLIGIRDWFKSRARVMLGTSIISPKEIAKNPIITDRFKGWDMEAYIDTLYQQAGVKSTLNPATKLARRGLSAFGALDRYFSAKAAATLYDAVYRKLQQTNPHYTQETLHTETMAEVEKSFGLKGQPMDWRQRPLLSSRNSFLTASSYFLGGEGLNTFANACRNWVNTIVTNKNLTPRQKAWALRRPAAIWATYGISLGLLNYAFNFLLDDDEHWQKRSFLGNLGFSAILGPIAGVPIISNLAAEATETLGRKAGINMPYLSTPSYLPMGNIGAQINNFTKVISEKTSTWDKIIAANDAIRSILFVTLLSNLRPTTTAGAAAKTTGLVGTAISNILDVFLRLGRATDERWYTPVTPSASTTTKKPKKAKQSTSPKQKQKLQRSADLLSL